MIGKRCCRPSREVNSTSTIRERLGPYSNLWARYLHWGVSHSLPYLDPVLIALYSCAFFLFATDLRRGIMANMQVLFPRSSWATNAFRALRVFWNFANVSVDSKRARNNPDCMEWEIVGLSQLDRLRDWPGGAIVATAHMGSYDLAALVFSEKLGRKLNIVRAPERTAELQVTRRRELTEKADAFLSIEYNEPGAMLGVKLARALGNGELVAVQADRVLFEVSSIEVAWEGRRIRLPQGPFVLAVTSNAPIFPLFITRLGRQRYRIEVREPILCQRQAGGNAAAVRQAAESWMNILGDVIYRHWDQWLVVEPAFASPRLA